jgi:integrase
MILVGYRHGLRVSELVDLRWDQVEFATAGLHVRRVKQGTPSTHPILGDELRALRRLQREQEPKSPYVFTSERGAPFSTAGFARMVERAGREAKLAFKAHPHMLRHACGYALYQIPEGLTHWGFPNRRGSDSRWRTKEVRHVGSDTIAAGF